MGSEMCIRDRLIGVAAGLGESELKFRRHVVPVGPVIEKLER